MKREAGSLIRAIEMKDLEQIKRYLIQGQCGSTPLLVAIETQDLNIIKLLIEYSTIYKKWDYKTKLAFYSAVKKGNLDIIQYLLEQYPEALANETNFESFIPLHTAIESKHIHVIRYFLSKGVNINACKKDNKKTALHIASALGSLEIVNLLLENNAEVNALDHFNQNPLYGAVDNGHTDVANVLIRAGTNLNHRDFVQCTVLYQAVQKLRIEVIEDLVQFGADVSQDKYLMHVAVANKSVEVMKVLQQAGVQLTVEDDFGCTPLTTACYLGHFSIAEYLLQNDVCPNTIRKTSGNIGSTALCNCILGIKQPDILQKFLVLLLEYNVNLEQSLMNRNAFSYAIDKGNFMAACLLVKYGFDVNCIDEACLKNCFTITRKRKFVPLLKNLDDFIKLLICAGFNFKNVQILKDRNNNISVFIEHLMSRPRSLKDLCRIRIRKSLGKWVMINLYKLPLPKLLYGFLALDIL